MSAEPKFSSDIAFTPAVKAVQERKGSRRGYSRMEINGSWETEITPELKGFIETRTTAFLATVSGDAQPYIQHRGGPPGFLKVLDSHTIGFVDFTGNRQYITQGNLLENRKAHLFLIDYTHKQRVKLWGEAEVVEGDDELASLLMAPDYNAKAEQVILFKVKAWDANCPQHIPRMIDVDTVQQFLEQRDRKIAELEAEVARLTSRVTGY